MSWNGLAAAFLGQGLMTPGADTPGPVARGALGDGRDNQGRECPQGSGIHIPTSRVAISI